MPVVQPIVRPVEQTRTPSANAADAVFHIPEIDGLRCVAYLLVLFHHALITQVTFANPALDVLNVCIHAIHENGWAGVDLFFVLGGFLITSILLKERRLTGGVSLKNFYGRRVLRIFPVYYLFLAGVLAAYLCGFISIPLNWFALASYAAFTANIVLAFGTFTPGLPLCGPLWSLCIEEHFYLGWGVLLKRVGSIRALTAFLVVVYIGNVLTRIALAVKSHDWHTFYFFTLAHLDGLIWGSLLACHMDSVRSFFQIRQGLARVLQWTAAAAALGAACVYADACSSVWHFAALMTLEPIAFVVLLGGMIVTGNAFFRSPAVRAVGQRSYVMYVVQTAAFSVGVTLVNQPYCHLPNGVLLTISFVLSLAVGEVVRRLVELPCARMKGRLSAVRTGADEARQSSSSAHRQNSSDRLNSGSEKLCAAGDGGAPGNPGYVVLSTTGCRPLRVRDAEKRFSIAALAIICILSSGIALYFCLQQPLSESLLQRFNPCYVEALQRLSSLSMVSLPLKQLAAAGCALLLIVSVLGNWLQRKQWPSTLVSFTNAILLCGLLASASVLISIVPATAPVLSGTAVAFISYLLCLVPTRKSSATWMSRLIPVLQIGTVCMTLPVLLCQLVLPPDTTLSLALAHLEPIAQTARNLADGLGVSTQAPFAGGIVSPMLFGFMQRYAPAFDLGAVLRTDQVLQIAAAVLCGLLYFRHGHGRFGSVFSTFAVVALTNSLWMSHSPELIGFRNLALIGFAAACCSLPKRLSRGSSAAVAALLGVASGICLMSDFALALPCLVTSLWFLLAGSRRSNGGELARKAQSVLTYFVSLSMCSAAVISFSSVLFGHAVNFAQWKNVLSALVEPKETLQIPANAVLFLWLAMHCGFVFIRNSMYPRLAGAAKFEASMALLCVLWIAMQCAGWNSDNAVLTALIPYGFVLIGTLRGLAGPPQGKEATVPTERSGVAHSARKGNGSSEAAEQDSGYRLVRRAAALVALFAVCTNVVPRLFQQYNELNANRIASSSAHYQPVSGVLVSKRAASRIDSEAQFIARRSAGSDLRYLSRDGLLVSEVLNSSRAVPLTASIPKTKQEYVSVLSSVLSGKSSAPILVALPDTKSIIFDAESKSLRAVALGLQPVYKPVEQNDDWIVLARSR